MKITSPRTYAFTLVELIIVVMIIAIIAAIVIPRFNDNSSGAEETTVKNNLRAMRVMLERYKATHGDYPTEIDGSWFTGGSVPDHPQNTFGVDMVENVSTDGSTDPAVKILDADADGAYWYNAATGKVKARVLYQGSIGATNTLYAEVNGDN